MSTQKKSGSTTKNEKIAVVSASQLETFMMCPRKWWFSRVQKLPQLLQKHLIIGTVLHSVLERWLRADSQGYVDGKPAEIYPKQWHIAKEKVDLGERKEIEIALDLGEQTLVKSLVKLGTDTGVVKRTPGRKVEHEFFREVAPDTWIKGYIDLLLPQGIEDHKTRKNKRWAGTPKKLQSNLQMLVYAQEFLTQQEENGARPNTVRIAHNVFIKDPKAPVVKKVETEVTRTQIEDNWAECEIAFDAMASLRQIEEASDWAHVPGPIQTDACSAYGGCAFARICGNMEKVGRYKDRIIRTNERIIDQKPAPAAKERQTVGSIFDKLNKMGAKTKGGGISSRVESKKAPPPEPETDEEEEPELFPWRNPNCSACDGTGMNSKGNPCRICNSFRKKQGLPTDEDFEISRDEDLVTVLANKNVELFGECQSRFKSDEPETQDSDEDEEEQGPPPSKKKKKRKRRTRKTAPVAEEPEDVETKPEPVSEEKEEVVTSQGFTLLINASAEGTRPLEKIFGACSKELAEALGEEDYYQCDPFKRRDTLAANIGAVAKQLRGWYTLSARSPDMDAFAAALMPYATRVIRGTN